MPTARIDGIDIYYERHGDAGEPLVFVHGHTGDVSNWRHQLPEFSRTHRVLVMDLRGHGRSHAPEDSGGYTIERMSHDVEDLVAEVGFARYHLVGHSMGGAMAQEIALRSPGRVLSLTLFDTWHLMRFDGGIAKFQAAREHIARTQGMAAVSQMGAGGSLKPYETEERKTEERERLSRMAVSSFIGAWNAIATWGGSKERAHKIAAPTLVLYGDLDAPPVVAGAQWLARVIPGAGEVVVPDAGHAPQFERPDLFNAALRRHLDRNAAGAAK